MTTTESKTSTLDRWGQFVRDARERIDDMGANNLFGIRAGEVGQKRRMLDIVLSRYEVSRDQFFENTEAVQALAESRGPGKRSIDQQEWKLSVEDAGSLQLNVRVDVESFYQFAKMFLDDLALFSAFYFGDDCKDSRTHAGLTELLPTFCEDRGLDLPDELLARAEDLKARVSRFRDKQVVHDKSADLRATKFASEETMLARVKLGSGNGNDKPDSEPPPDLLKDLDPYFDLIIEFLTQNESKSVIVEADGE